MIVLDASAVVDLLLRLAPAPSIDARLADTDETMHAPQLLPIEVAQVLRRWERKGTIGAERAREALDDLADLDIMYYDHTDLIDRVWALRENLTAYDAAYVALAEALDSPLLTSDARLARAPGLPATIELVAPD